MNNNEGSKEGFFSRWARLKSDAADSAEPAPGAQQPSSVPPSAPGSTVAGSSSPASSLHASGTASPAVSGTVQQAAPAPDSEKPLPTLEDAAQLDAGSDYSSFVGRGVDKDVRRLAMKKLFADPHFNVIDGLDIYMGDYNKPDPVSPAMLAALGHAQSFFAQVAIVEGREEQGGAQAAPEQQLTPTDGAAEPSPEQHPEESNEQARQPDLATGSAQATASDVTSINAADRAASSEVLPEPCGQSPTLQSSQ
jgi:hypothetical protein